MRLVTIPEKKYHQYKLDVIFNGYKWDPQYLDNNTISKHVLVITEEEHIELERFTEKLYKETVCAELVLNGDYSNNMELLKPLAFPRRIRNELSDMRNYQADKHIRLMRFDFHPTVDGGWALSEVNSDVPGGFAEASKMPEIAAGLFTGALIADSGENFSTKNFGNVLAEAFKSKLKPGGKIMFVHCTSYSDDRQAMQYLGDKMESLGFRAIYAASDHLQFIDNKAVSVLDGNTGEIDAIFRFTPLEWLVTVKPKRWSGYFSTETPSCNHPIAIYTQTKRFPFVWDALEKRGVDLSAWRELLPETVGTRSVRRVENNNEYIYKPVYGRVGEKISIKEACKEDEYKKILKDVKRKPHKYIAQKKFISKPLISDAGDSFHVCLGSYSVDGKAAGYYARISDKPRIDSGAADIPVLIERSEK